MKNVFIEHVEKSKTSCFMKWFFLIISMLILIPTLIFYCSWKTKEKNYTKQYVYSDDSSLYYENSWQKVYVTKIYNTSDEEIDLKIPNKETVIMYCDKTNTHECIYFDMNNNLDANILNPSVAIFMGLFCLAISIFFNNKRFKKSSLARLVLVYSLLLITGISIIIWQGYKLLNYFTLKNDTNVVVATIYSKIYNYNTNTKYKPVLYYEVNNQKYIYVNDLYINGSFEDEIGKTIELYYDKDNPSRAISKNNPLNILFILTSILFISISVPGILNVRSSKNKINDNFTK